MKFFSAALALVVALSSLPVVGATSQPRRTTKKRSTKKSSVVHKKDAPIHITSKRLVYNNETRLARFSGQVVATQADLTIRSEFLDAHYGGKEGRLEKIVAWRNVIIDKNGTIARSKKAVYYATRRLVILTGEPRVVKKDSVLTGNKMTLFLDKDQVLVENAQGRIQMEANQMPPWMQKNKPKQQPKTRKP